MHNLGHTRSANRRDHLLHTPDTFVRTPLPGMQNGAAIVHVSPAAGAAFTQYTAELDAAGTARPHASPALRLRPQRRRRPRHRHQLSTRSRPAATPTSPPACPHAHRARRLRASPSSKSPTSRSRGSPRPRLLVGNEIDIASTAAHGRPRPPGPQACCPTIPPSTSPSTP